VLAGCHVHGWEDLGCVWSGCVVLGVPCASESLERECRGCVGVCFLHVCACVCMCCV